MNDHYLMQHISYHLHTYVRKYKNTGELLDSFCARIGFDDTPEGSHIMSVCNSICNTPDLPILLTVNQQIVYAVVPALNLYYIIGPVRLSSTEYLKYHYSNQNWQIEWLNSVPSCDTKDLTSDVLLIYNLFREEPLTEHNLLLSNYIHQEAEEEINKFFSELVFVNREYGKTHNPYDQEIREFSSIENGNLEQLKKSIEEDYTGELGTLSKNPVRNMKDLGIVVVTLASRAAIRGGLLPEVSFSLSDSYIQKLEECNDVTTLLHMTREAEVHYTQLVHELKIREAGMAEKDRNPHIRKCKDYIFSHLHGKLTVQDIADELGLNPNYLSELFKKCEHISLTKYIQKEKISLAKNLLIYSHYSYIEIATYLGYSSQSHLGRQFKEETGYTLRKYRDTFGKNEFTW